MHFEQNFIGKNGFTWFVGVVEDRNDPLKAGRVRVRPFGWSTDNKADIKTSDLPWAQIALPVTSGAVNGTGETPGLQEGTWVFGFFMDGIEAQEPIITHSIPGLPIKAPVSSKGYNDPRTNLAGTPKIVTDATYSSSGGNPSFTEENAGPYPKTLDEPDISALARREDDYATNTIVKRKTDSRNAGQTGIPTADGGSSWSEPAVPYNAQYPYNKVKQTESGHVMEFDDTVGAERVHLYHRTGSFAEFHPDGSLVIKSVKDLYEIIHKALYVHSGGDMNLTSDKALRIKAGTGDMKFEVTSGSFKIVNGASSIEVTPSAITIISPRIDLNP